MAIRLAYINAPDARPLAWADHMTETTVEDLIALYGPAKIEGEDASKPSSSTPKAKPKRGGHKKPKGADVSHETLIRVVKSTGAEPEDVASRLIALLSLHQQKVGLIPTIPPAEPPQPKSGRETSISKYPTEMFTTLFTLLMEGYSLNRICMREDMPHESTIRMWAIENPSFYTRYAAARDLGLHKRAEGMRDEMATCPDPIRAKLLFEHDKWMLAKMLPKRYGERSEFTMHQTVEHKHVIDVSQLDAEAVDALELALSAARSLPDHTQDVVKGLVNADPDAS